MRQRTGAKVINENKIQIVVALAVGDGRSMVLKKGGNIWFSASTEMCPALRCCFSYRLLVSNKVLQAYNHSYCKVQEIYY